MTGYEGYKSIFITTSKYSDIPWRI